MTILSLRPSEIRYSQDSIANYFRNGRYSGIPIGQTLDDLLQETCNIRDIPTITVSSRDGLWYSGDNRRLWVFRKCEELGIIDTVPVREGYINCSKFTTCNRGVSIPVRGNPGGHIWTQRNRKDLVIKEPEPPKPVEPSVPADSGLVVQPSLPEEENISNSELSDSSEDLTSIAYDSDQCPSKGDTEETHSCLRSCLPYEGHDNPTFVGDGNDQQRMPGIKDQTSQSTLNGPAHSDNDYMSVNLSTLDEGPLAPVDSAVIDIHNNGPSVLGTEHLTVSRPMDSVEEFKLGDRIPSLTTISNKIGNCFLKNPCVWFTFAIILNILCLILWMLRLVM